MDCRRKNRAQGRGFVARFGTVVGVDSAGSADDFGCYWCYTGCLSC